MHMGNIVKRLREQRAVLWVSIVVGVILVFSLGVATGDGRLRLLPASEYKDETGLPARLDYASLNQIYDALRANYNGTLSEDQVLDGMKHGLANAANDPYTQYFSPKEAKAFNGQLQGISLTGIGAELDQDADGHIVVMAPINGSPAAAAGVQAKDVITAIDHQPTTGMSLSQAVTKIRGTKGSKVVLDISRSGQPLTLTITRDVITVPTATGKVLDDGVGYLQISQFSNDTYGLVQNAVKTFKQQGVKKVIVDLRDNPGGEVDSAKDITSLWLPKGSVIMQERRGSETVDSYRATGVNTLQGMPTVVLVNAGSASASEITALALHDSKAATIFGEKSYGKGVVQSVIPFGDGSELKVTIAKWYSPTGTSINKKGIAPDQAVTQSQADTDNGVDTQLQTAKAYLETK
jgi:carboxyl-terminal processing protease